MWKDMGKGEITFVYIVWLISLLVMTFGLFNLFGIGQDVIGNILPDSVVERTASNPADTTIIDTAKDTMLNLAGGNTTNILLALVGYVVLASLIFFLIASLKRGVSGIYIFGIFLHFIIGVVLILGTLTIVVE